MSNDTAADDAASTLFNLDDYAVLSVEGAGSGRLVLVEPRNPEAPCLACFGVLPPHPSPARAPRQGRGLRL
ncbi:hypothetical protein [Paeniglutamicibacter antarcticus]|uniref:hypothetical protein n=1 Tax=Paeniglutamicibacter antarcticus TaxID=494023 RepID=UPI001AE837B3